MTLPGFLIVGAMKAGTTSLYRDLLTNPAIFMPIDKEPNHLRADDVLSATGRAEYARHFERARPDQLCGEASTAYTMQPRFTGVTERALEVLGRDVRIIYLVREPVARIVSHHHHASAAGRLDEPDVNRAVHTHQPLLDFTRYAMQIEPWIDAYGADRVRVIRSETYRAQRRETIDELSRFLGVDPRPDLVDTDVVYNRSRGKPVPKGPFAIVQRNRLYRTLVRPLLPIGMKDRLRRALLPGAPPHHEPPTAETVDWIYDELADDMRRLAAIMDLDAVPWDVAETRAAYAPASSSHRRSVAPSLP